MVGENQWLAKSLTLHCTADKILASPSLSYDFIEHICFFFVDPMFDYEWGKLEKTASAPEKEEPSRLVQSVLRYLRIHIKVLMS